MKIMDRLTFETKNNHKNIPKQSSADKVRQNIAAIWAYLRLDFQ